MKITRFFIPILLIFSVLLFSCGKKKQGRITEEMMPKTVLNHRVEAEEEIEEAPKVITYKVILKDKTLSLFEINGEIKKLITAIEINPDFYPQEDIFNLEKGIDAYCLEDGYEILENFAN